MYHFVISVFREYICVSISEMVSDSVYFKFLFLRQDLPM